jgi:hypothetical protein
LEGFAVIKRTTVLAFCLALCGVAQADNSLLDSVRTADSQSLGLSLSSYSNNDAESSFKALNFGVVYQGIKALTGERFVVFDADYATGPDTYSGSLGDLVIPKYYYDLKLSIGKDLVYDSYVLSPYIGLGYRFLKQSGGGLFTPTGNYFYDRQSTYNYIPVGLKRRIALADGATLETTVEYDYLISGNQYSGLSAANNASGYTGATNVNNKQNSGYGLNASLMYRRPDGWSFGPYWKYWNIDASESALRSYNSANYPTTELANTTEEFGIKALFKF